MFATGLLDIGPVVPGERQTSGKFTTIKRTGNGKNHQKSFLLKGFGSVELKQLVHGHLAIFISTCINQAFGIHLVNNIFLSTTGAAKTVLRVINAL